MKQQIILASGSPRRKQLLSQINLNFKVVTVRIDESIKKNESPIAYTNRLSVNKAKIAALKYPNNIIIAADTVVTINNQIIGKPKNKNHAGKILLQLSGQKHQVITGFTVLDSQSKKQVSKAVATDVLVKKLTRDEINNYIKTNEPLDKAGSYGIQGLGCFLVEKINGDYNNVVGLPLFDLIKVLKQFKINILK